MSRDVDAEYTPDGWRIYAPVIDLDASIGKQRDRPELTLRWWRDESDRYVARSSSPMMVRLFECGHTEHEFNHRIPPHGVGKCGTCRLVGWSFELLKPMVWSDPNPDPIADILAGIKAARRSGRNPPTRWERDPLQHKITTPICALCREPVDEWNSIRDALNQRTVYSAWCHGREDVVIVTDQQLSAAERGTIYVWGQLLL